MSSLKNFRCSHLIFFVVLIIGFIFTVLASLGLVLAAWIFFCVSIALGILLGRYISKMIRNTTIQLHGLLTQRQTEPLDLSLFGGEFVDLAANLNLLHESTQIMLKDVEELSLAGEAGKLTQRLNITNHQGSIRAIAEKINSTLDLFIAPVNTSLTLLIQELQQGNLNIKINGEFHGDHAAMKDTLNSAVLMIKSYVDEISSTVERIANGDLTTEITTEYRGDFIKLKDAINRIIRSFNLLMSDINTAANQVAAGAQQISDSSQIISKGTVQQSSAIEELTAATSTIAEKTKQNALDAAQTSNLSREVKESAVDGDKKMAAMQVSMQDIQASSTNVSGIIKAIEDIAFQTNILALNAAVEAAHAGSHGKGFTVVAEEVRSLAGESTQATNQITTYIENSVQRVNAGIDIADQTAMALQKIVEGSEQASSLVSSIAQASQEQAAALSQVLIGFENLTGIVVQNSATSQQTAAAAEELSSQALLLEQMVKRFRLNGDEPSEINDLVMEPDEIDIDEKIEALLSDETIEYFPLVYVED